MVELTLIRSAIGLFANISRDIQSEEVRPAIVVPTLVALLSYSAGGVFERTGL